MSNLSIWIALFSVCSFFIGYHIAKALILRAALKSLDDAFHTGAEKGLRQAHEQFHQICETNGLSYSDLVQGGEDTKETKMTYGFNLKGKQHD